MRYNKDEYLTELAREYVRCELRCPGYYADSLDIEMRDHIYEDTVIRAVRQVYAEQLSVDVQRVVVETPYYDTWWDHFKDKCLPDRLKGNIKMDVKRDIIDIKVKAIYPACEKFMGETAFPRIECISLPEYKHPGGGVYGDAIVTIRIEADKC